jgi:hypothetical protein
MSSNKIDIDVTATPILIEPEASGDYQPPIRATLLGRSTTGGVPFVVGHNTYVAPQYKVPAGYYPLKVDRKRENAEISKDDGLDELHQLISTASDDRVFKFQPTRLKFVKKNLRHILYSKNYEFPYHPHPFNSKLTSKPSDKNPVPIRAHMDGFEDDFNDKGWPYDHGFVVQDSEEIQFGVDLLAFEAFAIRSFQANLGEPRARAELWVEFLHCKNDFSVNKEDSTRIYYIDNKDFFAIKRLLVYTDPLTLGDVRDFEERIQRLLTKSDSSRKEEERQLCFTLVPPFGELAAAQFKNPIKVDYGITTSEFIESYKSASVPPVPVSRQAVAAVSFVAKTLADLSKAKADTNQKVSTSTVDDVNRDAQRSSYVDTKDNPIKAATKAFNAIASGAFEVKPSNRDEWRELFRAEHTASGRTPQSN